jgi:hypothetical protein
MYGSPGIEPRFLCHQNQSGVVPTELPVLSAGKDLEILLNAILPIESEGL